MFFAVRTKTEKPGHLRIDPSDRIRKRERFQFADARAFANTHRPGAPIPYFVERSNQRAIKGRAEECAGSVTLMMFEALDSVRGISSHFFNQAEIIQLAAQFAKCFTYEVSAGCRCQRCEASAK